MLKNKSNVCYNPAARTRLHFAGVVEHRLHTCVLGAAAGATVILPAGGGAGGSRFRLGIMQRVPSIALESLSSRLHTMWLCLFGTQLDPPPPSGGWPGGELGEVKVGDAAHHAPHRIASEPLPLTGVPDVHGVVAAPRWLELLPIHRHVLQPSAC